MKAGFSDPSTIVVVGGSAAGLFAAREFAQHGRQVRVLESSPNLDPVPRTLIVTSRLLDVVAQLPAGVIVNEIRRFELFSDGHAASISLRQPDLVIERATLIRGLAEQARAAGAQVLTNHRVRTFYASPRSLGVVVDRSGHTGDEIRANTVIGADGAFSNVARTVGWPSPATVPLLQAIVRLPKDLPPDTTRVWFIPEDTPYFYWLIPESPSRGAVGLIGEDGCVARTCLERFMERRGLEPLGFQAARIPVYTGWLPARRLGAGEVHLVGDAAAHVKVTTIGGIVTGLRGAAGVVEQVLRGRTGNLRRLRRELDCHLLIRRALHRLGQNDYSRLLDLIGPRTKQLLGQYTRDEVNRILLGLLITEPRLLLVGLRSILCGRSTGFGHSGTI